jgi:formylglycine-generating enzyme required for sulfatase activity
MTRGRSGIPEATVQALSRASTESAAPRPAHDSRALKHAARICAVVAAGLLMYSWIAPSHAPRAPAPSGMVAIDVGTIEVGRDADEIERECSEIGAGCAHKHMVREVPRTRTTIPRFFIDVHEVTNEEFARMLNDFTNLVVVDPNTDDDDHYPRYVRIDRGTGDRNIVLDLYRDTRGIDYDTHQRFQTRAGHEKLPVSKVSWYGAALFCNSHGKRLPSEDEWEAAARGRADRRFPWGSELPRCGDVVIKNDGRVPMSGDCAGQDVAVRAVGSAVQDVTPDGVHDLGGNVAEWTASRFIAGRRASGPGGPGDAPRVIRGGSWASSLMVRTTGRWEKDPSVMPENAGFRCASDAETREP